MKGLVFRYIFADLAATLVGSILVFSGILLVNILFRTADLLLTSGVSAGHFLDLVVALVPLLLSMTAPLSLLLALLLVYGRMAEQNELLALAAGGVNYRRIMAPGMAVAGVLFFALLFSENIAGPKADKLERTAKLNIIQEAALIGLEEGVFIDRFPGHVIYVRRIDPDLDSPLQGIVINRMDEEEGNELQATILAREGEVFIDPDFEFLTLNMGGGTVYAMGEETHTVGTFTHASFGLHVQNLVRSLSKAQSGERNYSTRELLEDARRLERNLPRDPQAREHILSRVRRLMKVFHFRLAVPAICLTIPFLAIPLALWTRSGRKSFAFGLSIVSVLFYYILMTLGKALIKDGTVSPLVGSWMPVVVLFMIGILLTWKVTRH